jgi:hypothetical protein
MNARGVLISSVAVCMTACSAVAVKPTTTAATRHTTQPLDSIITTTPTDITSIAHACESLNAAHAGVVCDADAETFPPSLLIGFIDQPAGDYYLESSITIFVAPFCTAAPIGLVSFAIKSPPLGEMYDCETGEHSGWFSR